MFQIVQYYFMLKAKSIVALSFTIPRIYFINRLTHVKCFLSCSKKKDFMCATKRIQQFRHKKRILANIGIYYHDKIKNKNTNKILKYVFFKWLENILKKKCVSNHFSLSPTTFIYANVKKVAILQAIQCGFILIFPDVTMVIILNKFLLLFCPRVATTAFIIRG